MRPIPASTQRKSSWHATRKPADNQPQPPVSCLALLPPLLLSPGIPLPKPGALGLQLSRHPLPLLGEEKLRGLDALAGGELTGGAGQGSRRCRRSAAGATPSAAVPRAATTRSPVVPAPAVLLAAARGPVLFARPSPVPAAVATGVDGGTAAVADARKMPSGRGSNRHDARGAAAAATAAAAAGTVPG